MGRRARQLIVAATLTVCLGYTTASLAAVTQSGDYSNVATGSGWDRYIGKTGTGQLDVTGGSLFSGVAGYVGHSSGSNGTANVSGIGSRWISSGNLYIGSSGAGTLSVSGGGAVSNAWGYLGYYTGSSGTATVTGIGSKWISSGNQWFGVSGTASLTVADGAQISGSGATLGSSAGSSANALITGAGTTWTNNTFTIGYDGTATLVLSAGAQITTANSSAVAGGVGTADVTVRDPGSKWTTGALYVGSRGNGALTIESGAQVVSTTSSIGDSAGAAGSVVVRGSASSWSSTDLKIGPLGSGTLTVSDGAGVTAKTLFASTDYLLGNGTINAQGAVMDRDLIFDATHGLTQTISFGSGGELHLNFDGGGALGAGYRGSGSIRIADGQTVNSSGGHLGYGAASSGTATVSGASSRWLSSAAIWAGVKGSGSLAVSDGAEVSATGGILGYEAGSSGTAAISGINAKWTNSGDISIGYRGTGTVQVSGGGQLTTSKANMAYVAGSTGAATFDGAGTTWTNPGELYVGRAGRGDLNISSGAKVSSGASYLAYDKNAIGNVTVTGAGSAFAVAGALRVGGSGNGRLELADGGQVSSQSGYIASGASGVGEVIVRGTGSQWFNSDAVAVGDVGMGSVTVSDGGVVISGPVVVGASVGSVGAVTIRSAGSAWHTTSLTIGQSGSGSLSVDDGALFTTETLYASMSDLHGDGYINARSLIVDADLVFDREVLWLPFGSGGRLNLLGDGSHTLGVGYRKSGSLRISDGTALSMANGYLAYASSSSASAVVSGPGSKWLGTGLLYIGHSGQASLTVENGAEVRFDQRISVGNAGNVVANVTGPGSSLSSSFIWVGSSGEGTLNIDAGAQVTGTTFWSGGYGYPPKQVATNVRGEGSRLTAQTMHLAGSLNVSGGGDVVSGTATLGGRASTNTASASVSGTGSTWNNSSGLTLGDVGPGVLNVADYGRVSSESLSIRALSAARLRVTGNDMIVLGSTNVTGSLVNNGSIRLQADAFLPGGAYTPISEYAGRALAWSGTGDVTALGGRWYDTTRTFVVFPITPLAVGQVEPITTGERLLISTGDGHDVGISFGNVGSLTTFAGTPLNQADEASLTALLLPGEDLLSGWDFSTNYTGGEALLSFELVEQAKAIRVWHLQDVAWSVFTPEFLSVSDGVASFGVSSFSGYALSGVVPEPGLVCVMMSVAIPTLLRRQRRR